jgi:hypothetical protein
MLQPLKGTAVIAFALALAGPAPALAEADYAALVRDILIVQQCGLADEIVEAGFRLQATALVETAAVSAEAAAEARDLGESEYRQAWRDHGGGPVDPRCRREGAAAAARFRAYIMEE